MVYPKQLTLQMRQRQLKSLFPDPVTGSYNIKFAGPNPLSVVPVYFDTDPTYIDYTDFVDGLEKFNLSFSTTQTPDGQAEAGQFVPKKGVSGTLTFEREAYEWLRNILVDDVAAPLNQVEVQITDISSGKYTGFVIKSSQLSWCEFNSLCTYDVNLKQEDLYTQCIQRTMIADNWQGWFQPQPAEIAPGVTKKHPRFSYCTEHRPNGTLVILWYVTGFLGFLATIIFGTTIAYNGILFIINFLIFIINGIVDAVNALGGSLDHVDTIPYPDPLAVFAGYAQLYVEAAGCGREHPAPLVRDYITNVCNKCGISVDATSAEIFFAPIIAIQKSDGIIHNEPNPHYNACYFFPNVKRGVRRYASINLFGTSVRDTTTYYEPLNQPVLALSDLLDQLKKVYNAQWRVITDASGAPFLHFHRKDWFQDQAPLYDFSVGGADRHRLLEGICYEPTDYTIPASCNGLWQDDPGDRCGHEASRQQNGDPLSFNNTIINPLFHGILDKNSGFGAAKFRLDGATNDWIYDAGQVVLNGELLNPLVGGQMDTVFGDGNDLGIRTYADFALTLQSETCSLPKILLWDGKNNQGYGTASNAFLNARAVVDRIYIGASETSVGVEYFLGHTAYPGTNPDVTTPAINTKYPAQVPASPVVLPTLIAPSTVPALLDWQDAKAYPPDTHVIGHSLSFSPPVAGKYTVQNYFGTVISQNAAFLVNYPMYFQPYYQNSMWDWFHWIDDPYSFPRLHKNWRLKIPLCKEDLEKLQLLGDGSGVKLLFTVRLDAKFYNSGVITDMVVGYETGADSGAPGTGQYIELKGYV